MFLEIDIPKDDVSEILQYVNNKTISVTPPFYTVIPNQLLMDTIGKTYNLSSLISAYAYAHTQPIPLHVDRYNANAVYNLCVPLFREHDQTLMVFDQEFTQYGVTWHVDKQKFHSHKPASSDDQSKSKIANDHHKSVVLDGIRPCDTIGVTGLTGKDVFGNFEFVESTDFYFGLSGKSWDWMPGKALNFKSSQLHGTGKQRGFKIGCVLLMEEPILTN